MLFAVWNDDHRELRIANAGSVQPMLLTHSNGEAEVHEIKAEGFPLGLFPNATYDEVTLTTSPGDLVVFFSDGIADAENREKEMFGTERICSTLENHAPRTAEDAVAAVLSAVDSFQAGTEHFDDETLVIMRVL